MIDKRKTYNPYRDMTSLGGKSNKDMIAAIAVFACLTIGAVIVGAALLAAWIA